MSTFETADYYDCLNSEELTYTEVEEAIEAYLENLITPNCDVASIIQEAGAITVQAHTKMVMPPSTIQHIAARLVDTAIDEWEAEFGDPDHDSEELDDPAFVQQMAALLTTFYQKAVAYMCEPCGEREYSVDEVTTLMRKHRPDWFA